MSLVAVSRSRPYKFDYVYKSYHAGPSKGYHIPIHGGISVINPRRLKRAAVGGIVTKAGVPYITLNEHFARSREPAQVGQPLVGYNAGGDWSSSSPPVAVIRPYPGSRAESAYMDVAIAEALVPVSFEIPAIGIPTGSTAPRKGMRVAMSGATSGLVRGTVVEVDSPTYRRVNKETGSALFDTEPPGTRIRNVMVSSMQSQPGDSGSWVFEEATKKVVGVHFAVGPGGKGERSVRADAVASAFGISFTGRPGVVQPARGSSAAPPVTGVGSGFDGNLTRGDTVLPSNPLEAIQAIISGKAGKQYQMVLLGIGGIAVMYMLTRGR